MKRVVCIICCIMVLVIPSVVFAESESSEQIEHQEVEMSDNSSTESQTFTLEVEESVLNSDTGLSPYATFKGEGGSVTLDCVNGKAFNVKYNLYHTTTSYFEGEIKIYTAKDKKYKCTLPVQARTPLRSALVLMPQLKTGAKYTAYITGTAVGYNLAVKYVAKVIPNAHISFTYGK